ncbi:hypothetical protein C1645_767602, partial [Glomus cerebriforme]
MFICISSNFVFNNIGLFPQFFFSFIFISNLYSYTLFLTNSISFFSFILSGFLSLFFATQPTIMIIFLFF